MNWIKLEVINPEQASIERAAKMGIPAEDIIIDPLVMTVGHNSNAAMVMLKTIELVKQECGVNISLGSTIRATDLLLGKDTNSIRYLKYFRAMEKLRQQEAAVKVCGL